jgi:[FeFe] hydrogenase H-cluster maturation GTPase HydF
MKKSKDIKPHIGIFGRRNNGKSSFINSMCGSEIAIVSEHAGTTTDPVKKSVEIFGIGPAILIDTAGIDDVGDLGAKRIEKSLAVVQQIDLAVLVIAHNNFGEYEQSLVDEFKKFNVPYITVHSKEDVEKLTETTASELEKQLSKPVYRFSSITKENFDTVVKAMVESMPKSAFVSPSLFDGILEENSLVLLVTPIDSEAPEGRMILPQVMAIRHALDKHAMLVVVRETELEAFFKKGLKPDLVVTDSQAFGYVSSIVPEDVLLTGFSVLFARLKADFDHYMAGTPKLSDLKDGDRILILESCTHHVSCEDIGRYKLPKWINEFSKKQIEYDVVSGLTKIERPIEDYALIIQCGGCVVTRKQLTSRLKPALDAQVAVSNYGLAIAYMEGIFDRSVEVFKRANNKSNA